MNNKTRYILLCQYSFAFFTVAANLVNNQYTYFNNLLALEAQSGVPGSTHMHIIGFLPIAAWEPFLCCYPDQRFAAFLRRGITSGFRIGFNQSSPLHTNHRNHSSVSRLASQVDAYIAEELAAGKLRRITQPIGIHTSPIGLIPKRNRPGKFRLIVDLSAPAGHSVNDGISPHWSSFKYTSIQEAALKVRGGAFMAKIDLRSAYRMVPVHPSDHWLLGVSWQGSTYCDLALPFGLRSAPIIFSGVADALAWAMLRRGIPAVLHYLDDFLLWSQDAPSCHANLVNAIDLCSILGLPAEPTKVEGPATTITFLGIQIDSIKEELRLPPAKLASLKQTLLQWSRKRAATKREFQVLLGHLNHAATVIPAGKPFLRNLIDTMSGLKDPSHYARLNSHCRSDIAWWLTFVDSWNGVNLFPRRPVGPSVTADASGSWGCGAYCSAPPVRWFQIQWPPSWSGTHIAAKELFPLVVSAAIWGSSWHGLRIKFFSDNQAVVQALSSRTTKDSNLAHLLRCLFFFEAHFHFEHSSQHISGIRNTAADALSRNRVSEFFSVYPQAQQTPSPIPAPLLELLLDHTMSWTSPRWKDLFTSSLQMELQPAPVRPTPQPNLGISTSALASE